VSKVSGWAVVLIISVVVVVIAGASLVASLSDNEPDSTAPAVPKSTILDLVRGQAPRRVAVYVDDSCLVSPESGLYRVSCSDANFLVNLDAGVVTPGNDDTKRLWDRAATAK
jgi:hypothetical protein